MRRESVVRWIDHNNGKLVEIYEYDQKPLSAETNTNIESQANEPNDLTEDEHRMIVDFVRLYEQHVRYSSGQANVFNIDGVIEDEMVRQKGLGISGNQLGDNVRLFVGEKIAEIADAFPKRLSFVIPRQALDQVVHLVEAIVEKDESSNPREIYHVLMRQCREYANNNAFIDGKLSPEQYNQLKIAVSRLGVKIPEGDKLLEMTEDVEEDSAAEGAESPHGSVHRANSSNTDQLSRNNQALWRQSVNVENQELAQHGGEIQRSQGQNLQSPRRVTTGCGCSVS